MKWDSRNGAWRRTGGFTLVEMLLVLTILALLAAIVLPNIMRHGPESKKKAAGIQIKAFEQAFQMFELDNGNLPKGKDGLNALQQRPRDAKNWNGPYLEPIPKDPWEHDYVYDCPGKHRPASFDLMSMGPDGQPGTEDDIVNWVMPNTATVTGR